MNQVAQTLPSQSHTFPIFHRDLGFTEVRIFMILDLISAVMIVKVICGIFFVVTLAQGLKSHGEDGAAGDGHHGGEGHHGNGSHGEDGHHGGEGHHGNGSHGEDGHHEGEGNHGGEGHHGGEGSSNNTNVTCSEGGVKSLNLIII